jgi:hypothetical protein
MSAFPIPFPSPSLPPFAWDFDNFFSAVSLRVAEMRQARNQLPLVPDGAILMGQESLSKMIDAPSIVVVPRGYSYRPARNTRQDQTSFSPHILWSQWMRLEAHCWGDEDPNQRSELYSFSTATDLSRQLLVALQGLNGGVPRVEISGAEWAQKSDVNRRGRMLVMSVSIETFVEDDPPILMPYATKATPGVQGEIVMNLTSPDGSQTTTEATFVAPP